ncbi:MAG: hypothetical protein ACI9W6_000221 [Motiliproteus sp.]|jgi:hypothetical protein
MGYEDTQVRDFFYHLISKRLRIYSILVAPWLHTGSVVNTDMGPTLLLVSYELIDKIKDGLGMHPTLTLRSIKGREIHYINRANHSNSKLFKINNYE